MSTFDLVLQQIFNGLSLGSIYALTALGYTMVYGVLRLINFAHGEILMLGAMIGAWLAPVFLASGFSSTWVLLLVMLFAAPICVAVSLIMERFAYRPLRNAPRLAPLITALAMSILLQTIAMMIWSPNPLPFPSLLPETSITFLGVVLIKKHIGVLLVSLVTMGALLLLVTKTKLGRAMRACSENPEVAELVGINTNRIISITFAIGAALAAVAGVLMAETYNTVQFTMGLTPGIKAFTAAVMGGIGNIVGAAIGGILLGILESLGTVYLSDFTYGIFGSQYQDLLVFLVLIVVLWIRSPRYEVSDRA